MANGQVGSAKEILMNCALTLDNHTFLFDLMPMVIGSLMSSLVWDGYPQTMSKLLCLEKALRLPIQNGEPLTFHGDKPSRNIRSVSCIKAKNTCRKSISPF